MMELPDISTFTLKHLLGLFMMGGGGREEDKVNLLSRAIFLLESCITVWRIAFEWESCSGQMSWLYYILQCYYFVQGWIPQWLHLKNYLKNSIVRLY